MKNQIIIRQANKGDLDDLVRIDRDAFPPDWPKELLLGKEQFQSCMETFPEGVLIARLNDEMEGYIIVEILDYKVAVSSSWSVATDSAFLKKSHKPNGDVLYGVSLCTSKEHVNLGVGGKLFETAFNKFAVKDNLRYGIFGSRVPEYYKHANKMSIKEYVFAKREDGRALDPLLAFYQRLGCKIESIIKNYMKDPESMNYGVIMSIANPLYKK